MGSNARSIASLETWQDPEIARKRHEARQRAFQDLRTFPLRSAKGAVTGIRRIMAEGHADPEVERLLGLAQELQAGIEALPRMEAA